MYFYLNIVFLDAQIQDPVKVAIDGNDVEMPINLGDDYRIIGYIGESIALNSGSKFNLTYEDTSTISSCEIAIPNQKRYLFHFS